MKVKDLIEILNKTNPEDIVRVRLDGSIFPTDNVTEHLDYNYFDSGEFYVLALEKFEDCEDVEELK